MSVPEEPATSTREVVPGFADLLPPQRSSVEEERAYRKQSLADALRLLAMHGMNQGAAGHITVRDPGDPTMFWVNPLLKNFALMTPEDLLLVNEKGEVVEGSGPLNRAAFAIHSRIHRARPDVHAAAHCHSAYGEAWSTQRRLLTALSQDSCAFFECHGLYDDYTGVVLDLGEGDRIAAALGSGKAVILRNHGLLTVGRSVEEAAWWLIAMEQACQVQLLAEAAGKAWAIDDDMARLTAGQVGDPAAGELQFAHALQVLPPLPPRKA
ncbi:class II aldolase/adducin family protein [Nakamurella sp. YIM 132087]|uniref:Class II aldolase/adducin family protein n=1 Tax=Nakamurella alba TaxID=2665158 RepID=A0A7K1FIU1_9ACTN|nr:class II aldolase/adducin family protein [Nakamurella alba]MTD14032.1 class II aldolase/adducin family protein [Nakamurella alba]